MNHLVENHELPQFKSQTFGGYSKQEVNLFLNQLAQQQKKLEQENKELKEQVKAQTQVISRHNKLEGLLQENLLGVKAVKEDMIKAAEKESRSMVMKSQMKADDLLRSAKQKAENILKDANEKYREKIDLLRQEIKYLEAHYNRLENNIEVVLKNMRNVAHDITQKADTLESKKNVASFEHRSMGIKEGMKSSPIVTRPSAKSFSGIVDSEGRPIDLDGNLPADGLYKMSKNPQN